MKTNFTIGLAVLCFLLTLSISAKAESTFYKSAESLDSCAITIELATTVTCSEGGSIVATIDDGTEPYSYLWNDGSTDLSLTGLQSGTYTLIAVDANGCTDTASVEIFVADSLNPNGYVTMGICGDENGIINTFPLGGSAPYTFSWNTGDTTPSLNVPFGIYSVTVTDANGCTASDTFTVVNTASMVPVLNIIGDTCSLSQGVVEVTMTGGTEPYSFVWSTGDTVATLTGLTAGTYSITVTDSFSCVTTTAFEVPGTPNPFVASNVVSTDCGVDSGAIFLVTTGGILPYTFLWNTGDTIDAITNIAGGQYVVTVTDSIGCVCVDTIDVQVNGIIPELELVATNSICGDSTGLVDLNINTGTEPYDIIWNTSASSEDLDGVAEGVYYVTVTGDDNCSTADSITVECDSLTSSENDLVMNGTEILLFPNPANDIITLVTNIVGKADIRIYNTVGQLVILEQVNHIGEQRTLDISHLPVGVYTVMMTNESSSWSVKLRKQ